MAEDLNQQEPTAEEKAKFENDVLKAAEDAMKMDGSTGSPSENKADAQAEEKVAEPSDAPAENAADAAEQPADAAAEQPAEDPTATLKAALADANDRNLRPGQMLNMLFPFSSSSVKLFMQFCIIVCYF